MTSVSFMGPVGVAAHQSSNGHTHHETQQRTWDVVLRQTVALYVLIKSAWRSVFASCSRVWSLRRNPMAYHPLSRMVAVRG